MSDLILPRSWASVATDESRKHVSEMLFQDGTTVFSYREGSINHTPVVINPNGTAEHPPTDELVMVRGLMSFLYRTGWSGFFKGKGIHEAFLRQRTPEDTDFEEDITEVSDFNRYTKEDHYHDYVNTVAYLTRLGVVPHDALDGSNYEKLSIEL